MIYIKRELKFKNVCAIIWHY